MLETECRSTSLFPLWQGPQAAPAPHQCCLQKHHHLPHAAQSLTVLKEVRPWKSKNTWMVCHIDIVTLSHYCLRGWCGSHTRALESMDTEMKRWSPELTVQGQLKQMYRLLPLKHEIKSLCELKSTLMTAIGLPLGKYAFAGIVLKCFKSFVQFSEFLSFLDLGQL